MREIEIINQINRCNKIEGVELRAVMITPDVAKNLLQANTHNRKISKSVVGKYVQEILNGEWYLSAQGIGFSSEGILLDGQQRLTAITESGVDTPMLIITGLPPVSQEKMDRQKRRLLHEAFALAGYAVDKSEVQIGIFLATLDPDSGIPRSFTPSDSEVKLALNHHKQSILKVLNIIGARVKGFRVGFLSACVIFNEFNDTKALQFMTNVKEGVMLAADSPELRLRKFLMGEGGYVKTKQIRGRQGTITDYRKTMFAINAFLEGKSISGLKESEKIEI